MSDDPEARPRKEPGDEPSDVDQGFSAFAETLTKTGVDTRLDPLQEEQLAQRRQQVAATCGPRHTRFTLSVCLLLTGLATTQVCLAGVFRSAPLLGIAAATLLIAGLAWRKSHWFQFNLRTAFVGMVLVSMPLAWVGSVVRRYQQEDAAIERLAQEWFGMCIRTYEHLPAWFRQRCPDDWLPVFGYVDQVYISAGTFGDDGVAAFDSFHSLRTIYLNNTQVSDQGVEHLTRHRQLRSLYLHGTAVTPKALVAIERLPELVLLDVSNTAITMADTREFKERHPKVRVDASFRNWRAMPGQR